MGYQLGVDLGTTWSAAATCRDGQVETVSLGHRSAALPSTVYLGPDDVVLVGEAAEQRSVLQPASVARDFKRRVGDHQPLLVGGRAVTPEALMGLVFAAVLARVAEREGGPPDQVAVSHPANWNPAKVGQLRSALAHSAPDVVMVPEPHAAAIAYAAAARIEAGQTVAVYDLGGGTFDSAVLRRTAQGFELLGRPEGIERLGGIDFDAAVHAHVGRLVPAVADCDGNDSATMAAARARLRADCVTAKELLSTDTQTQIAVLLPGLHTDVLLTRAELETMIRPALTESIAALRRTITQAGLDPAEVDAVLAVGGSSRIPLVTELLSAELGRPVVVDADPKHVVAPGAARVAAEHARPAPPPSPAGREPADEPAVTAPVPAPAAPVGADGGPPRRRLPAVAAVAAVAAVVVVGGIGVALSRGGGDPNADAGNTAAAPSSSTGAPAGAEATAVSAAVTGSSAPATATRGDAGCRTGASPVAACITEVRLDDGGDGVVEPDDYLVTDFTTAGFTPASSGPATHQLHFYFPVGAIAADLRNAGTSGPSPGGYLRWNGSSPFEPGLGIAPFTVGAARLAGARQLCVIVADANGAVIDGSGDCAPLPREIVD